jgi:uncharacterized membrane-anchored protein
MRSAAGNSVRALRVPEITVYFWLAKGLSTALGESTSNYLVSSVANPGRAVGVFGFVVSLVVQFAMRRYNAWSYWFAVAMVGVFGTMAADVLHVSFVVVCTISALLYGTSYSPSTCCGSGSSGLCRSTASTGRAASCSTGRRWSRPSGWARRPVT